MISKSNDCLHVNLPKAVKNLGFEFQNYVTVQLNPDESITIKKIDLDLN